jgi:hypothetical protein
LYAGQKAGHGAVVSQFENAAQKTGNQPENIHSEKA